MWDSHIFEEISYMIKRYSGMILKQVTIKKKQ